MFRLPGHLFIAVLTSAVLLLAGAAVADTAQVAKPQLKSAPIKPMPLVDGRLTPNKPAAAEEAARAQRTIAQLDELIELGLPATALSIINQNQQAARPYSADWYLFERKRISVLTLLEDWPQIIDRTRKLLGDSQRVARLPQPVTDWFLTQQAIALVKSGQAEAALQVLRKLIWSPARYERGALFALWRQLVVRAYLVDDNIRDAETAMLRYDYDYRDTGYALSPDWLQTRAGVLFRAGRYRQVMALLKDAEDSALHALYLLAKLRADKSSAAAIKKELKQASDGKLVSRSQQWANRYLAYEIARLGGNRKHIITALQALLSVGEISHPLKQIVRVSADDLWKLYKQIGVELGNRYRLLNGDDDAWYSKAMQLKSRDTLKTLSLLTALALQSREPHHRQMAHAELLSILEKRKNSMDLISQLYLHSSLIPSLKVMPVATRLALIDHALAKKQIGDAARLMQSLDDIPPDQDAFIWQLRKARVLIMQGEYDAGIRVLTKLFASLPALKPEQVDHLLQVLFDLQSVQQHQAALRFFRVLQAQPLDFQTRRELYFWMAESEYALGNYATAAMLYLKSARAEDGSMHDQWALSSRLKAAESLVKAGLYDDAQTVYQRLLKVTANPSRRAMIEQEMQQIVLLKNARRAGVE